MARLLLRNGDLVDPVSGSIRQRDIWIDNGRVIKIGLSRATRQRIVVDDGTCEEIDCEGLLVVPGLIDMHVHFRTPGQEHKESLATGSMAALAGGFTSVVCMANTKPVIDNEEKLNKLFILAENEALVNILQVAAVTSGRQGKELTEIWKLFLDGAAAFSDDGDGIQDPAILSQAIKEFVGYKKPILLHCQDNRFDTYDKRAEIHDVSLVIRCAESCNAPIHIQHVSCAESVQLIREAKARGVKVTCETAPHYMALTQRDFKRIGVNAMMNPPLRGNADRDAVIQGLVDGTIDVIATDHAPHTDKEKKSDKPPFGIIGLETAVPVVLSVLQRHLSLPEIFAKMTINPARILGLEQKGLIHEGWPADITVIDLKKRKALEAKDLQSKSQNSPWLGKRMQGWPVMTIHNGKIMMREGKIIL
ncbi:MAG: dihydroorotase [Candidatus Parcubacteria bacterium]|nr:dihydroorotase [Candidatus Parcubacteria bacterium]